MKTPLVAVIDIGSNSIKILVTTRNAAGELIDLASATIEARISAGIHQREPELSAEGMQRGLEAILDLLAIAQPHAPTITQLVATSAVRDARNGAQFRELVESATGCPIRILSGREEADFIGQGLICDPNLSALTDFYLFDLGGGSLECLAFAQRRIQQAVSLQLGCVRLTEKHVSDRTAPIAADALAEIAHDTITTLREHPFAFELDKWAVAVGTGGTITTARAMLAAKRNQTMAESDSRLKVADLRLLLVDVARLTLDDRRKIPGLSSARADVFPAALATLIAVADEGNLTSFQHSFYNLRYGVAAELLGA